MKIIDSIRRLGPGLITGAADDDPSGIATYSQAGAQFGTSLMWTMVLTYPLMVAVQLASAHVGRVTGHGLAHSLRAIMPRWLLIALVVMLFVANTINIGADLAAMGEAAAMVTHGGKHLFTLAFAVVSVILQLYVPYRLYGGWLKWMTLVLLSYVAMVFVVKIDWHQLAVGLFVPHIAGAAAITTVVAILGTTISPYLFFWQASQEVEEIDQSDEREPLLDDTRQAPDAFNRIRWDTLAGMAVSNLVALAILLATAATLHAAGKTDIQSAADAARALLPVAGQFAYALFTLGIIGTGLMAVPVLAGSSAYATCEIGGWAASLEDKPTRAKAFYTVITVGMALGLGIDWSGISPMKALFWSAVINGVVAVPVLVGLMLVITRTAVMGDFTASRWVVWLGWLTALLMGIAAVAMVVLPA